MLRSTAIIACALLLVGHGASASENNGPDLDDGWYARIETSRGTIVARLLPEQAPQSVAHFAGLAEGSLEWTDHATGKAEKLRYYDKIPIHRAEAGHLFEVGNATLAGRGTPRLYVPREGFGPVRFDRPGRLGMARDGGRMSGVVFFVTAAAIPWFEGKFPCFGEVLSDLETIRRITQVDADPTGRPLDPVMVEKIEVFSVGDVEPLPEPERYEPIAPTPRIKLDALR